MKDVKWDPITGVVIDATVVWSQSTKFRVYYISGVEVSKEEFEEKRR